MTLAYIPPGVNVQELTSPSVAPLLAIPGSVCLVGLSSGSITRTDIVNLFGTVPTVLPGVPVNATMSSGAIISIIDALQPQLAPSGFSPSTDYTFSNTNHTVARQVTAQTLSVNASAAASTFTLSSGAVPTPGQVISLSDLAATFTATTTVNSNILTVVSSTSGLIVGQTVAGTGIPGGAVITSIDTPHSTVSLSNVASANGTTISLTASNLELVTVAAGGVTGQVVTTTTPLRYNHNRSIGSPPSAVTWGNIPDADALYVTYTYTPLDYFTPIRLNSMADIQTRFGSAWDSTGTVVNSTLSFAAGMAFQNGASNVVLQPLYAGTAVAPVQPTAAQAADPSVWGTVFAGLQSQEDINIVVPVVGQSATGGNVSDSVQLQIAEAAQDYVYQMLNSNDQYVIAVVGEDSSASASVAQEATMLSHAQILIPRYGGAVTEQMVYVNTSQFSVANSSSGVLVGGQYVAAAIAGMLAARDPSSTLTRQAVAGFLAVTDNRTKVQKNVDAGSGMLVIESAGNVVQVRHGITMDATNSATRELSVVRAKHFIIESLKNTLNTQIIGRIVADSDAPTLVNNVVIATLEDLRGLGELQSYANVQSAITSFDPTTMAISFDYRPAFVINYINLTFTLDLTNSSVTALVSGATL